MQYAYIVLMCIWNKKAAIFNMKFNSNLHITLLMNNYKVQITWNFVMLYRYNKTNLSYEPTSMDFFTLLSFAVTLFAYVNNLLKLHQGSVISL